MRQSLPLFALALLVAERPRPLAEVRGCPWWLEESEAFRVSADGVVLTYDVPYVFRIHVQSCERRVAK